MRKIGFIAFVLLLVSCNQQSAFQYNKKIVTIQKAILDSLEIVSADTIAAENYRLEKIQEITSRRLNELKTLEAPKAGIDLKTALINDIEALYSYNGTLLQMTKLPENDTAFFTLQNKLVTIKDNLDRYDNILIREQEKFAKAHSFKLENK